MYIYKCPNEVELQGGPNYFLSVRGCKGFLCLQEFSGALVECNTKKEIRWSPISNRLSTRKPNYYCDYYGSGQTWRFYWTSKYYWLTNWENYYFP